VVQGNCHGRGGLRLEKVKPLFYPSLKIDIERKLYSLPQEPIMLYEPEDIELEPSSPVNLSEPAWEPSTHYGIYLQVPMNSYSSFQTKPRLVSFLQHQHQVLCTTGLALLKVKYIESHN